MWDVLQWRGPAFLGLFAALGGLSIVLAFVTRRYLRGPKLEATPDLLSVLHPQQIAYLRSGAKGAVCAAIAGLVAADRLRVDVPRARLVLGPPSPPEAEGGWAYRHIPQSDRLEAAILARVSEGDASVEEVVKAAEPLAPSLEAELIEMGLYQRDEDHTRFRWLPVVYPIAVGASGFLKILVGMARDRPVEYLVKILFCLLAFVVLHVLASRTRCTLLGQDVLRKLSEANDALRVTAQADADQLSGYDAALAVSVFGPTALAGTALAAMMLPVRAAARGRGFGVWGCGGGCGSSCGSSCGGGGGCGGCGGCGG